MVLCGKLHGRVGRCREYYAVKKASSEKSFEAFLFVREEGRGKRAELMQFPTGAIGGWAASAGG
jgi:hypothetical protein